MNQEMFKLRQSYEYEAADLREQVRMLQNQLDGQEKKKHKRKKEKWAEPQIVEMLDKLNSTMQEMSNTKMSSSTRKSSLNNSGSKRTKV